MRFFLQVSYFQKTTVPPKKRVSLVCLSHSFDNDIVLALRTNTCVYSSTIAGPLFPIVTDQISEWHALPTANKILQIKSMLFSETLTSIDRDDTNHSSHPMAMQAKMFSDLIKDILASDCQNVAAVVPSLYALQQCLRSGWQTDCISEVR